MVATAAGGGRLAAAPDARPPRPPAGPPAGPPGGPPSPRLRPGPPRLHRLPDKTRLVPFARPQVSRANRSPGGRGLDGGRRVPCVGRQLGREPPEGRGPSPRRPTMVRVVFTNSAKGFHGGRRVRLK